MTRGKEVVNVVQFVVCRYGSVVKLVGTFHMVSVVMVGSLTERGCRNIMLVCVI